ncbi:putative protein-S-isoprenylcysteine methyltransferase [Encephalitozoon intestinalis ATCC 50506]|uniref:Protein-S-isoprenylcysteine O-methyltransferase n=1 Tax=Encephalitozoon intestinalis (strain ATCC 50506) TaxID=876142 RepID=E0S5K6_ENCIT|nr:putative protein-S-isoprenylcysteine methyltransferase [Encephalitozoon intestinalis ATCC 50506]ADM10991.1 putative protein-S-isoprenylcysteine methyltransferase [Encephalitozoon intestinalis ATCC 50506]UTX44628.1 putative protein-S-isoprenylcysteine methyltransferase [Encephalitozoon intestinalis]
MECPSFYFALGSLFMLGISHSGSYLSLHIVSSISLLVFMYSREKARRINLETKILRHSDLVLLFGSLFLESLFVSRSTGYLGARVFKIMAACGLVLSIAFFHITLGYVGENKSERKKIQRNGPYRYVRHPLYSSLILHWISCCIYLSCFISLAIFLWFVSSWIIPRIKEYERELISASPEYTEYRKIVWSGIPMYK